MAEMTEQERQEDLLGAYAVWYWTRQRWEREGRDASLAAANLGMRATHLWHYYQVTEEQAIAYALAHPE